MARPPASLPPTPLSQNKTNPLAVSLIVGSYSHSPFTMELFDLYLPPSQPAPEHPEDKFFRPQPEIKHTFRPEQKLPSKFVSGLGALFVGAGPWVLLLGLVRLSPAAAKDNADQEMLLCYASSGLYSSHKSRSRPLTFYRRVSCPSRSLSPRLRRCCSGTGST